MSGKPSLASQAVFVLVTGDEFLRKRDINLLIEQKLSPASRPTNLRRIYPDELNWISLLEEARTPSLLGDLQVFWISGLDQVKAKKDDWSFFEQYCENPADRSFFIFEAENLPKTHPLLKWIPKLGQHRNFSEQGSEASTRFVREKFKAAGKRITPEAWQLLLEKLGGAPLLLDQCADQLILHHDSEVIDESSVEALASEWFKYDPFELTQALLERKTTRALEVLHYFYDLDGDVMGLIGLVHWQLRRLWLAKRALVSKSDRSELAKKLKIQPFRLQSFLAEASKFSLFDLEALIDRLWELDWKVKTGAVEGRLALETFFASAS